MKNTVLFLSRSTWRLGYWNGKGVWQVQEFSYGEDNLQLLLKEVAKISMRWEVLLDEDVSYFKIIAHENPINRSLIAQKISSLVPEAVDSLQWDWKVKDAHSYFLEVVGEFAWKILMAGKKNGLEWTGVTTIGYWKVQHPKAIMDIPQIMLQTAREKEENGRDENALKIEMHPHESRFRIWWLIGVTILLLLGVGGYYFTKRDISKEPVSTQLQLENPSPSPTTEPQPADYNLRVENGGAKTGEATRIGQIFTDQGFSNVEIENSLEKIQGARVTSKGELAQPIRGAIEQVLEGYEIEFLNTLPQDDPIDIFIVIGEY